MPVVFPLKNCTRDPAATLYRQSKIGLQASNIDVSGQAFLVTREIDGGMQTLKAPLPAVFTADLRLNEPRYATLPNIMKAKKKAIDTKAVEDVGVEVSPRIEIVSLDDPPKRSAGITVEDVNELATKLKDEAGVL